MLNQLDADFNWVNIVCVILRGWKSYCKSLLELELNENSL